MKKHKKDYMDFIDAGNSPEDYDIMRKPHKRHSNAHNHKIVARVQELVDTDSSKRTWDTNLIKGQLMSKATKLQQLEKTKKLLSCLKHPPTRRFGPLAVQTATPLTIMSGASLKGILIKPPKALRSL